MDNTTYPKIIGWCYMANKIKTTSSWYTTDWVFEAKNSTYPDSILVDTWKESESNGTNSHALFAYDGKNHNLTYHDTWIRVQLSENDFHGLVSNLTIEFGVRTSNSLDYIITVVNNQSDFFPKNENGQSLYKTSYPPQIDNYNSQTKKYDMWMIDTSGNRISVNDKILSQAKAERIGTTNRLKVVLPPFKATSNIIDLNLKCLGLGVYYDDTTYQGRKRWTLSAELTSNVKITYYDRNNTLLAEEETEYGTSISLKNYYNINKDTIPQHFYFWKDENNNQYQANDIITITDDITLTADTTNKIFITDLQEILHQGEKVITSTSNFHFSINYPSERDYFIAGDKIDIVPMNGYYCNDKAITIQTENNQINIYSQKIIITYHIPDDENWTQEQSYYYGASEINITPTRFTTYGISFQPIVVDGQAVNATLEKTQWVTKDKSRIIINGNNIQELQQILNNTSHGYTIDVWPLFIVSLNRGDYKIESITATQNGQEVAIKETNFFDSSNNIKKFAANISDSDAQYTINIQSTEPYTVKVNNAEYTYHPHGKTSNPIPAGYYSFSKNGCFAQLYIDEKKGEYLKLLPADGEILHIYSVKPNKIIQFKTPNNVYIKLNQKERENNA